MWIAKTGVVNEDDMAANLAGPLYRKLVMLDSVKSCTSCKLQSNYIYFAMPLVSADTLWPLPLSLHKVATMK